MKRPTSGLFRIFVIFGVSLLLFFSMSGFIPLSKPEESSTASAPSLIEELQSTASHNLLVDQNELRCLALNIYFEARSESLMGKLAVAGVTMNRVADEKFPNTICGVVKQGVEKPRHRCQFSWWCDGKVDAPKEIKAWRASQQLARLYLAGVYSDPSGNALWYHADYVSPYWAGKLEKTYKIGRHIFYSDTVRQTVALY